MTEFKKSVDWIRCQDFVVQVCFQTGMLLTLALPIFCFIESKVNWVHAFLIVSYICFLKLLLISFKQGRNF